jgi:sugar phosphate isomerase/epimerase
MSHLRIGVRLESLGLPLRRGLQEVERLGVTGVQVDAAGDLAPKALSQSGRREFCHLLRAHNLELTAVGCPLRHGLDTAVGQEARIEHVRQVMNQSFDLGPRRVIVQAGRIPEDAADTRGRLLTEALLALAHHGDRTGTVLAVETGLETGQILRAFLDRFDSGGLGVNLDPANLLVNGFDPYESARALAGRVVHVHAQDARPASPNRAGQLVPLGQGDIDWLRYLSLLEEIDYHGWLVVEQEAGDNRLGGVATGVQLLRRLVGQDSP